MRIGGVGIAQHRLEVMAAAMERAGEHQLVIEQTLTRLGAPAFSHIRAAAPWHKGQQMQRTGEQVQGEWFQQLLQALTPLNRTTDHGVDALKTKLAQTEPQLEDFSRACALQAALSAMGIGLAGPHVGEPRCEGLGQEAWLAQQQQRGGLGDAEQLLRIHGCRIR